MQTSTENINPDLLKERRNCTFDIEEFAIWWNNGKQNLQEKREIDKIYLEVVNEKGEVPLSYLSHKERYEYTLKKTLQLLQILLRRLPKLEVKNGNYTECLVSLQLLIEFFQNAGIINEGFPIATHLYMFIHSILSQGTAEQQAEWIPRALNMNVLGTYAQTELAHGTFVRGLQTRADFDPEKEEFVLNCPSLDAYKWWPGGLGHTVNHSIVLAQLYTQGVHRGLYAFLVQVRDFETHRPLPGIIIGDIGPSGGMKALNNGFLGFENVRIPRKNMLMANAEVTKTGEFIKSRFPTVLTYATMVFVRVIIIRDNAVALSKAATIATRYSAVRRQSPIDPNKPEPQIMDHVTQQLKIFPIIAKTVVLKMTFSCLWKMYNSVVGEIERGLLDRLPEFHALTCCLKAVCSADTAAAVEICRLGCGGHGYMIASSLPSLYGLAAATCIFEGENTVLLLQTARYLMKSWKQALKGQKLTPTVAYLQQFAQTGASKKKWDASIPGIIYGLQCAAASKVRLAYESLEQRKRQGMKPEVANNLTGIELTQASALHCRLFLVQSVYEEIEKTAATVSPALLTVLRQIFELFAVDTCFTCMGDLIRFCNLSENDVSNLEGRLEALLAEIRPNAVGIVDGFDIADSVLNSTLGAYDGNVYERIFAEAKLNPLNQEPVNKTFELYLKPFMKANL